MKSLTRAFALISEKVGVIGPHADHEAALLLAGVKPVGWLCVPVQSSLDPGWRLEQRAVTALNQAVAKGLLSGRSFDYIAT